MQVYVESIQSAMCKLKAGGRLEEGSPLLPLSVVGGHPRAARLWEIADNTREREVTQLQTTHAIARIAEESAYLWYVALKVGLRRGEHRLSSWDRSCGSEGALCCLVHSPAGNPGYA